MSQYQLCHQSSLVSNQPAKFNYYYYYYSKQRFRCHNVKRSSSDNIPS